MRKAGQPDWQRAMSAQAEVLAMITKPGWTGYAVGWLGDRFKKYGRGATTPSAYAFGQVVEDIASSEPLYVTEEMQGLVYHAMETFDSAETLDLDDVFLRQGFALLEHQFVSTDRWNKKVGWRAISWRYRQVPTQMEGPNGEPEGEPVLKECITIMLWSHLDDPDDYPFPPEEVAEAKGRGQFWAVAHATTIPFDRFTDKQELANEGDPRAAWLIFWRVMQRLMAERIVVRDRRQVERAEWRRAKRLGLDIKDVIVVELRRVQHPSEDKGGKANYSHRFIRVGHWRLQPYGPRDNPTHRQRWIGRTVVGPDHLPLIVKDRVWVWDR